MRIFLFLLLYCCIFFSGVAQTLELYYAGAKEAYEENKYVVMLENIRQAHALRPNHQSIVDEVAIAEARNKHKKEATRNAGFSFTRPGTAPGRDVPGTQPRPPHPMTEDGSWHPEAQNPPPPGGRRGPIWPLRKAPEASAGEARGNSLCLRP